MLRALFTFVVLFCSVAMILFVYKIHLSMTMNDEYNLITIHFGSYESVAASAIGAL